MCCNLDLHVTNPASEPAKIVHAALDAMHSSLRAHTPDARGAAQEDKLVRWNAPFHLMLIFFNLLNLAKPMTTKEATTVLASARTENEQGDGKVGDGPLPPPAMTTLRWCGREL
jgi:hypothetical protein